MIKVKVGPNIYFYDSTTDMYDDYPEAVYINGCFVAYEKEGDDKQ